MILKPSINDDPRVDCKPRSIPFPTSVGINLPGCTSPDCVPYSSFSGRTLYNALPAPIPATPYPFFILCS
ncbi:hypothetical protein EAM_P207 (plasmid) [Erwinia amylovora ATCC 49946]|nr:hypothetical protein EAM_P207 [Erwinia amylovora ATCC 49946]